MFPSPRVSATAAGFADTWKTTGCRGKQVGLSPPQPHRPGIDMDEGRIHTHTATVEFQGQLRQDRTQESRHGEVHRLTAEMPGMDRRPSVFAFVSSVR